MYERISIGNRKSEVKSQNPISQIRRKAESFQSMNSPVDRIQFLQTLVKIPESIENVQNA